ncbi:hypothetical protein, partial [Arthrobacter sp. NPDC057013]|uniref:hypothetical protein n=1 Tax=Arthrobacter sp. NPDC057013 TaxID=3345999 RepID=UPI00362E7F6C
MDISVYSKLNQGYSQAEERHASINFGGKVVNPADAMKGTSTEKLSASYQVLDEAERNQREYKAMYEELKTEALQKKAEMEEAKRIEGIRKKVLNDLSKLPEFQ